MPQRLPRPRVAAGGADAAGVEVAADGVQRLPGQGPSGALADHLGLVLVEHGPGPALGVGVGGPVPERPGRAVELACLRGLLALADQPLGDVLGLPGVGRGQDAGDAPAGGGVQVEAGERT